MGPGVFIVSNAIIASVAVWNFFIAQAINYNRMSWKTGQVLIPSDLFSQSKSMLSSSFWAPSPWPSSLSCMSPISYLSRSFSIADIDWWHSESLVGCLAKIRCFAVCGSTVYGSGCSLRWSSVRLRVAILVRRLAECLL
jgi:hypothetical protein